MLLVWMIGSTTAFAQESQPSLKELLKENPRAASELEQIKSNLTKDMFHMEQRAIFAEDAADSLNIGWSIEMAKNDARRWYKSYEVGIGVGIALTLFAAWGYGQVAQ